MNWYPRSTYGFRHCWLGQSFHSIIKLTRISMVVTEAKKLVDFDVIIHAIQGVCWDFQYCKMCWGWHLKIIIENFHAALCSNSVELLLHDQPVFARHEVSLCIMQMAYCNGQIFFLWIDLIIERTWHEI